MTITPDRNATHERLVHAAIVLASAVSTDERIKADPDFAADRSRRADHLRAASMAEALADYRDAQAAFESSWSAA